MIYSKMICRLLLPKALVAIFALSGLFSFAQVSKPGNQIPSALEGISAAGESCRREDVNANKKSTPAGVNLAIDLQCSITVDSVHSLLRTKDVALIDRRDPMDYRSFHIEGSSNLNIAELIAKPYWISKKVILIGSGKAEAELYRECSRLKNKGYKSVYVMNGGLPSWFHKKLPFVGDSPNVSIMGDVTAAELLVEIQNPYNVVLIDKSKFKSIPELGSAFEISDGSPGVVEDFIIKYKKSNSKNQILGVVMVSKISDIEINRLRDSLREIPLLVYRGTREEIASQQNSNKAMWSAYARGPKTPRCGL